MKITWPSEGLWLIAYLVFAGLFGCILIVLHLQDQWLVILVAPILLAAVHYPRRAYLTMLTIMAVTTLIIIALTSPSFITSALAAGISILTAGVTGEIINQSLTVQRLSDERLKQHDAYLTALHETTLGLIDRLDLTDLLRSIVSRASSLVGTPHAFLYLVNPEGTRLEVKVGTGIYIDYIGYQLKSGEGLSGRVWQTGQPMRVNDYARWSNRANVFENTNFHAVAAVPLKSGAQIIGVIGVGRIDPNSQFSEAEVEILERFAELASVALDNAKLYQSSQRELTERKETESLLRHLSTHDALTGLCNRAFFEAEMTRLQHGRQWPISIIMADADDLKRINDTLGHAAGDALLNQAAATLRRSLRAEDIIARIGGDEFAVLLSQTDWPTAHDVVERLKNALASARNGTSSEGLNMSMGLATGTSGASLMQVMREADERMYEEKAARRRNELRSPDTDIAEHDGQLPHILYRLPDMIDLKQVQRMADNLYAAGGIPVGIIGIDGTIYVRAGWQDVCVKFHRADPRTCARCLDSDQHLARQLKADNGQPGAGYMEYKCLNQLWDVAVPIIVAGQHVATLFVGQFFYDDEQIDIELFRRQAVEFGFDEQAYLEAVRRAPVFSRDRVRMMMAYYTDLVQSLAAIGMAHLQQHQVEDVLLTERSLFMSGPTVVFRWGTADVRPIEYVSSNVQEQFGYAREELVSAHISYLSLLHPDDQKLAALEIVQYIRDDAIAYQQSYRIRDANGAYRWVDDYTTIVRDHSGRVIHYLGYIVDVTARKQTEEALRQNEATFRVLFENSPISLWEQDFSEVKRCLDRLRDAGVGDMRAYFETHPEAVAECLDGVKIVRANRASQTLYGAGSPDELLVNLGRYIMPDGHPRFVDELAWLSEGRTDFEWESTNHKLTGELIHIQARLSIIAGHEDTLDRVIVAIEDITEQKRVEESLQRRDKVLSAVAESALGLLGNLDVNQTIHDGLRRLGDATQVDRVYIFENSRQPGSGRLLMTQRYEWVRDGVSAQISNPALIGLPYADGFQRWETELSCGRPIKGLVRDFPPGERAILDPQDITSILVVPIVLGDRFWGFIGFDLVQELRDWSLAETAVLSAMAASIGSAIERMHTESALRDNYDLARQRLERLDMLHQVGLATTANKPPGAMLDDALSRILALPEIEACAVLLPGEDGQSLVTAACSPASAYPSGVGTVSLASPYAQMLAQPGIVVLHGRQSDALPASPADRLGVGSADWSAAALSAHGAFRGILEVYTQTGMESGQDWGSFVQSLSILIASSLESADMVASLQRSNQELQAAYEATIRGWSEALELRDKETRGHSERVVSLTLRLAQTFGIDGLALEHMMRGALLHDIGKMGIPDNILLRAGPLSQEDWVIMRQHTVYAYQLLKDIPYLQPALDIPHYHHERWDGTGYPSGLKGDHIPIAARIFAVVDTWDALTSNRPYRPAWPASEARHYLVEQSGRQFDPLVVEAFLQLLPNASTVD